MTEQNRGRDLFADFPNEVVDERASEILEELESFYSMIWFCDQAREFDCELSEFGAGALTSDDFAIAA